MHDNAAPILLDLIATLEQGRDLIAGLDPAHYGCAPTAIKASSVGAHYRHHLEHVHLLVMQRHKGLVNYDDRQRDVRLEHDLGFAIAHTNALIEALRDLSPDVLEESVTIAHHSCVNAPARCAPSTMQRELLFLLSHAIHHYALIKLVVESFGYQLNERFGVMPSTLLAHKHS